MIICVDIDGVICEYDFPKIVKDCFGVDLPAEKIFAYDLADVLGVSPDEINEMFKEQVWGEPKFIEGAVETLEEWRQKEYVITIFSNRTKYMGRNGLVKWLNKYSIPGFPTMSCGHKVDYHIDDSPAKLMKVNAKIKLLFNQPWNKRCLDIKKELKRVNNWQEIRNTIKGG